MSEEDKLLAFISELQEWAQTELWRQGVRGLPTAMATTNCLEDYKMGDPIDTMQKMKSDGGKKSKSNGKRRGMVAAPKGGENVK